MFDERQSTALEAGSQAMRLSVLEALAVARGQLQLFELRTLRGIPVSPDDVQRLVNFIGEALDGELA